MNLKKRKDKYIEMLVDFLFFFPDDGWLILFLIPLAAILEKNSKIPELCTEPRKNRKKETS